MESLVVGEAGEQVGCRRAEAAPGKSMGQARRSC